MSMTVRIAVVSAIFALPLAARANPVATAQLGLLDTFNLIDFGDRSGQSDSEGRVWIGGNFSGSLNVGLNGGITPSVRESATIDGTAAAGSTLNVNTGGVAVGGDAAGTINLNGSAGTTSRVAGSVNNLSLNGGALKYGGSVTGTINANGGATVQHVAGLTAGIPANTFDTLKTLTGTLDGQTANGTISVSNNGTATFTGPTTGHVAVFRITDGASFFTGLTGIQLALGGNTTSVEIDVDGGAQTITDHANMNGQAIASEVIWNFNDTAALNIDAEIGGTVLAPGATVTTQSNIDGTLVAGSLVQGAELHAHSFAGPLPDGGTPVPEPASLAAVAAGLVMFAVARRRRPSGPARSLDAA